MSTAISKEMHLQTFPSPEPQLTLEDAVLINIVSYLPDPEIISNISLVSRQFCNLSRETINRLGREYVFFANSSGLFVKTFSLLKLDNDPTATLVMKASRICRSFINEPLMDERLSALDFVGIDLRFGGLDPNDLGRVYTTASHRGNNVALKAIQVSGRFPEIPIYSRLGEVDSDDPCLLGAFREAAETNHPDCLQIIIDSGRFDQIDLFVLEASFSGASSNCQQAILVSGRASEISSSCLIRWGRSFAVVPEIFRRHVKPMIPLLELGIIAGLAILCRQYAQDS